MISISRKIERYAWSVNIIFKKYTSLFLYAADGLAGRIYFEPDNDYPTPHRFENNVPVLYMRWHEMPVVTDMIRNEGPVYIHTVINDNNSFGNAFLSTDAEYVGEGEEQES